jgi:BirA family biotin operon repressor/biotin-[acetyl-CoA-carboxylase] ligase
MFELPRIVDSGLVARVDYHESIGSTSDRALELGASDDGPFPLLVLAERQTAGRGRGENRWWSDDGALTFSLVLEASPKRLPVSDWPKIALVSGLAVYQAVERTLAGAQLQVKWPNDVYMNGRKLGGILSESIPGSRERLVVGIGINVNNRLQEPATFAAASLIEHDGQCRDLTDVLLAVLDELDRRWRQLLDGRFDSAASEYRQKCLLTGKRVRIEQPGNQSVAGMCLGIDNVGRLRVATQSGEVAVVSGTVAAWGR